MKRILFSLALWAGLTVMPGLIYAQTDVTVTANVLESLQVTAVANLQFGDIVAGNSKAVAPDDANSGRYEIQGEGGAEVNLEFDLPAELENNNDPSFTMPISYGAEDAIHHTENDASAGTSFDPNENQTVDLSDPDGDKFLFIGGEVTASPSQEPGNYEGTITLTVEYTAN